MAFAAASGKIDQSDITLFIRQWVTKKGSAEYPALPDHIYVYVEQLFYFFKISINDIVIIVLSAGIC